MKTARASFSRRPPARIARLPLLIGSLLAFSPVAAQPLRSSAPEAASAAVESWTMRGTVGPYPVGLSVSLTPGGTIVRGHYFYTRHLADIPLEGTTDGDHLTLTEPDGGRFDLHLTAASGAAAPLTFATATGLAGDWRKGSVRLPVALSFESMDSGVPGAARYAEVTDEAAAAYEARVRRFLRGVLDNDRARAAAAVSYPLRVNGPRRRIIRDRKALLAQWDSLFTPAYVATLRTAVPHDMFVRNGLAMVAGGALWFDARGAAVLNLP